METGIGSGIGIENIKRQLGEYAAMIADTVKNDTEIVNAKAERVAGTGFLSKNTPVISDGHIYKEAFRSGKYIVIQTPRKHPLCSRCFSQNRCLVALEIAYPLFYRGAEIGAIGVVCPDFAHKGKLLEDIGAHLGFLRLVEGLIGRDLAAHESTTSSGSRLECYSHFFRLSPDYAVMLNEDNTVVDMNDNMQKMFGEFHEYTGKAFLSPREDGVFITIHGKTSEFMSCDVQECGSMRIVTLYSPKNDLEELYRSIRKIDDLECAEIEKALAICGNDTGGKKKAAELLGIGVATLYRKLGGN